VAAYLRCCAAPTKVRSAFRRKPMSAIDAVDGSSTGT
jgi:hypothetical protein